MKHVTHLKNQNSQWKFRWKILIKILIDKKSDQKYDDKDSTENFYDENDRIFIWDFINSSNQTIIVKKKKRSTLSVTNISKTADVKQLADSFSLKK